MIVNRNSWHVKLNREWGGSTVAYALNGYTSLSLCVYFWETVKSLFTLIGAILGALLIGAAALYAVSSPVALIFSSFTGLWLDAKNYYELGLLILMSIIFIGPIVGVLATLFGPMKVFPKWFPVDKWFGMALSKTKEHSPENVNIFVEWVKAKKSKVCPIIEFKDGTND